MHAQFFCRLTRSSLFEAMVIMKTVVFVCDIQDTVPESPSQYSPKVTVDPAGPAYSMDWTNGLPPLVPVTISDVLSLPGPGVPVSKVIRLLPWVTVAVPWVT